MLTENFPNGDGYFHECSICGGTIGETDSMVVSDYQPIHTSCFE